MLTSFQRRLTQVFDVSIALKGIDGALEVIGGVALLAFSPAQLGRIISFVVQGELSEDPRDVLANLLLHTAANVTPHGKMVSVIFLLSHGLIKIFLVWQLFRGKLWAYPLTIASLSLFIVYQMVEIARHPSLPLLILTILDIIIVGLGLHEYVLRKRAIQQVQAERIA